MKTLQHTLNIVLSVMLSLNSLAQSHQPAPPPVNPGYPFIRSMSVDCTDLIIDDIANGNPGGLESNLVNYIRQNYIGYVVLRDLENASVFGDPIKEAALRQLTGDLHNSSPGIQIGIAAGIQAAVNSPVTINTPSFGNMNCPGANFISNYDQFLKEINSPAHSHGGVVRNSIINFFLQAASFASQTEFFNDNSECHFSFDALYVDYPYWNTTTSMQNMQSDFENFKSILSVMQVLKCNSSCIRFIDAEFLPTDLYKLQGWTAIDQITEADTLIDRVVLPSYTNSATGIFNLRCKMMHFLSDQFSKTGTRIFVKLSAESQSFNYCNSSSTPNNYLGNYLNGNIAFSGNMHSVEKYFLTSYNDINNVCPACNCSTYPDNHYSALQVRGNILAGSMWTPYTMLQSNQLYRKQNSASQNLSDNSSVEIKDLLGRQLGKFLNKQEAMEALKIFPGGIYLLVEKRNGQVKCQKIVSIE